LVTGGVELNLDLPVEQGRTDLIVADMRNQEIEAIADSKKINTFAAKVN
jgi:hypothetical protein